MNGAGFMSLEIGHFIPLVPFVALWLAQRFRNRTARQTEVHDQIADAVWKRDVEHAFAALGVQIGPDVKEGEKS